MSSHNEPPSKRPRQEIAETPQCALSENPLDIFSPKILENAASIASTYKSAKPYPHNVLPDLFERSFLMSVLEELKNNLKAKFKESDLFRVYQSIDFGNLDPSSTELHESIPHVMRLRQSLYSKQWRELVEDFSGLERGTLTNEVDCAINCHDTGCHLLCHDDVIGTRKISFILYLTDPEPVWIDEDGGRLELYDHTTEMTNGIENKIPGAIPSKTILPTFNSMAYFAVEPGVSFHSVQEVLGQKPRMSLQGWYHAAEPPSQIEQASLSQLKSEVDQEGQFIPYPNICNKLGTVKDEIDELTESDVEFLKEFINPTYLARKSISEIRERFEEDSSIQLRHFLKKEYETTASKLLKDEDTSCGNIGRSNPLPSLNYKTGLSDDTVLVGPAHKQRYVEYVGSANPSKSCGSVLQHFKESLLHSPQFGRLLKAYCSLGMPLGYRGKVRRFRPGLDYTIAHRGILTEKAVLDATLCFVAGGGNQNIDGEDEDDAIWQSDDKGGFECYIAAEDDNDGEMEADDEYDEEDDTKLLSVSASHNTLSLVYRDPGTMRFVKYLGSGAPSSRWDISLEYELEENEDDDEEQDPKAEGDDEVQSDV